ERGIPIEITISIDITISLIESECGIGQVGIFKNSKERERIC
ncbi:MAG: hypothetical protein JWM83_563, partial [Candidatus Angelobacter sp.]|nr:hypothetical protein [Candidatus Angelobacter sp.]